jgi:hypothetical protein
MNAEFTFDHLVSRKMNPEKVAVLQRVFDTVCKEAAIPASAKSERNELAQKLLTAGVTIVETSEYETLLLSQLKCPLRPGRHDHQVRA